MNIGCLLLFADFGTGYSAEEMGVPFLAGKHRDFDTAWYYDVGAKITVAMISNSLVGPFASKAFQPFVLIFLNRWFLDRCCKRHLRKLHNYNREKRAEEAERHEKAKAGENNPENPEGAEGGSIEMGTINEGGEETERELTYNYRDGTYYYDEGGADDQDVAGINLRLNLRPLVVIPLRRLLHVDAQPCCDFVVNRAKDFRFNSVSLIDSLGDSEQSLRVRHDRRSA